MRSRNGAVQGVLVFFGCGPVFGHLALVCLMLCASDRAVRQCY